MSICSCSLDVMYRPMSSVRTTRITLSLTINAKFVRCHVRASEIYSEAKRLFSVRNRDVLLKAKSSHKWWSILKSAVFGVSSSLPPLVGEGGGLVCESVGRADFLTSF